MSKNDPDSVVITGAFSYSAKYATRLLLDRGHKIRTLTSHPERHNPFGATVEVFPLEFSHPDRLTQVLQGASTLINTYWVRFPRGRITFQTAVENTCTLINAAKEAGVKRLVHVSIANPSLDSPLGYYKGKAKLEKAVTESGLSYAILRPTVIFGVEDVLINNIAWFLRRIPVFGIPGDGRYSVRPIYVGDMATLIADSVESLGDGICDAVGPETFTFEELVQLIAQRIGRSARFIHVPVSVAYAVTLLTGWLVRDVVLTWEEYKGLVDNLLASEGPTVGQTRLSQWLEANHDTIGRQYTSEVARHYAKTP
jgi:NADH dehydrogenase